MSGEKRLKEEFETHLKALLDNDDLKGNYQNPDAWRVPSPKKRRK